MCSHEHVRTELHNNGKLVPVLRVCHNGCHVGFCSVIRTCFCVLPFQLSHQRIYEQRAGFICNLVIVAGQSHWCDLIGANGIIPGIIGSITQRSAEKTFRCLILSFQESVVANTVSCQFIAIGQHNILCDNRQFLLLNRDRFRPGSTCNIVGSHIDYLPFMLACSHLPFCCVIAKHSNTACHLCAVQKRIFVPQFHHTFLAWQHVFCLSVSFGIVVDTDCNINTTSICTGIRTGIDLNRHGRFCCHNFIGTGIRFADVVAGTVGSFQLHRLCRVNTNMGLISAFHNDSDPIVFCLVCNLRKYTGRQSIIGSCLCTHPSQNHLTRIHRIYGRFITDLIVITGQTARRDRILSNRTFSRHIAPGIG